MDRGAKVGLRWPIGPFEIANRMGVGTASRIASEYATTAGLEVPRILSDRGSKPFDFNLIDIEVENGWRT